MIFPIGGHNNMTPDASASQTMLKSKISDGRLRYPEFQTPAEAPTACLMHFSGNRSPARCHSSLH